MLAAVFYMQPVGQLCANVVAISATALSRKNIQHDADPSSCIGECMQTTDKIWRWIVGLGAVIPALALLARLLIPESPRYLLEVEKDSHTAQQNANSYFTEFEDPFHDPEEEEYAEHSGMNGLTATGTESGQGQTEGMSMEELHNDKGQHAGDNPMNSIGNMAVQPDSDTIESYPQPGAQFLNASAVSSANLNGKFENELEQFKLPPPQQPTPSEGICIDILGTQADPEENPRTRKATRKEFLHGFHAFLFSPDWINTSVDSDHVPPPDPDTPSTERHWTDGNWTDLFGTSVSWALLDFSFYFLGVNSWKIIAKVWDTPSYSSVYELIIQFTWRALVSVSVGSIIGGALFITMANYRHKLQLWGFVILAVFLVAVGSTFVTLLGGRYFAAIIVLYFFTQLFFDIGTFDASQTFVRDEC